MENGNRYETTLLLSQARLTYLFEGIKKMKYRLNDIGLTFEDSDVVNPREFDVDGESVYGMKPWLIYGEFGTLAVVFATCEQDAFDEAVDANKLDSYQVSNEDIKEWEDENPGKDNDSWMCAGNASEIFDQTYLQIVALPLVPLSLGACMVAAGKATVEMLD